MRPTGINSSAFFVLGAYKNFLVDNINIYDI